MSVKNPSSCAQANNIGKTADNVRKIGDCTDK